jgi:hypothetical protein
MKKTMLRPGREVYWMLLMSLVLALGFGGYSYAQTPDDSYVTMSEKIGALIVLFRAFDVYIYVFQGILLFTGLGFTLFHLMQFHRSSFLVQLRKRVEALSDLGSREQVIEFEISSLANRFLFLEMMIAAAPVSGLLGTVVGLVQVFSEQTVVEHVTMQSIASGMYVAMVTTVCGLIVAIVGIIGRHFLNSRLADLREIIAEAK